MNCRYRFVFPSGRIECGMKIADPALLDRAARLAGALGVTVLVVQ